MDGFVQTSSRMPIPGFDRASTLLPDYLSILDRWFLRQAQAAAEQSLVWCCSTGQFNPQMIYYWQRESAQHHELPCRSGLCNQLIEEKILLSEEATFLMIGPLAWVLTWDRSDLRMTKSGGSPCSWEHLPVLQRADGTSMSSGDL